MGYGWNSNVLPRQITMKFSSEILTIFILIFIFPLFVIGQKTDPSDTMDCNSYKYQDRYKNGIPQYIGSEEIGSIQQYLESFIKQCPNSQYSESAKQLLPMVLENRAEHSLSIAKYYVKRTEEKKSGLKGAQSRLREISQKYPNFSKMDEVLFLLVKLYLIEEETVEAKTYYRRILDEFPFSPFVCEANKLFNPLLNAETRTK
jgi:TolA-binding protein